MQPVAYSPGLILVRVYKRGSNRVARVGCSGRSTPSRCAARTEGNRLRILSRLQWLMFAVEVCGGCNASCIPRTMEPRPSVAVADPRRRGVLLETEEPAPPRAAPRFACITGGCLGTTYILGGRLGGVSRLWRAISWRFYLRDTLQGSGK